MDTRIRGFQNRTTSRHRNAEPIRGADCSDLRQKVWDTVPPFFSPNSLGKKTIGAPKKWDTFFEVSILLFSAESGNLPVLRGHRIAFQEEPRHAIE